MGIAVLSGQRSKDPNRQVGACIVDAHKHILGVGYNGLPTGCNDQDLPWTGKEKCDGPVNLNDERFLNTKYPFVVHAEANSILNAQSKCLRGCTMYVALFPCNECTKLIIQSGIANIIYLSDKNHDQPAWVASRRMLDLAGIAYTKFDLRREEDIVISFQSIDQTLPEITSNPVQTSRRRSDFCFGVAVGALAVGLCLFSRGRS